MNDWQRGLDKTLQSINNNTSEIKGNLNTIVANKVEEKTAFLSEKTQDSTMACGKLAVEAAHKNARRMTQVSAAQIITICYNALTFPSISTEAVEYINNSAREMNLTDCTFGFNCDNRLGFHNPFEPKPTANKNNPNA